MSNILYTQSDLEIYMVFNFNFNELFHRIFLIWIMWITLNKTMSINKYLLIKYNYTFFRTVRTLDDNILSFKRFFAFSLCDRVFRFDSTVSIVLLVFLFQKHRFYKLSKHNVSRCRIRTNDVKKCSTALVDISTFLRSRPNPPVRRDGSSQSLPQGNRIIGLDRRPAGLGRGTGSGLDEHASSPGMNLRIQLIKRDYWPPGRISVTTRPESVISKTGRDNG